MPGDRETAEIGAFFGRTGFPLMIAARVSGQGVSGTCSVSVSAGCFSPGRVIPEAEALVRSVSTVGVC